MNRTLLLLGLVFLAAFPAAAQDATAKLYAKAEGDDVLVAVQVTPNPGCWIYDRGEETGGIPTTVDLGALDGAEWTDFWFPKAKSKDDGFGGTARVFDKKVVLYAAAPGAAKAGVDPKAVTARIDGQVCNERLCVQWGMDLERRSGGTDKLWSGFPAALLAGSPQVDPSSGGEAGAGDVPAWEPDFGAEKALARAFARTLDDDVVELVVQVATPEHWHMYHGPTDADMGPGIGTPTVLEVEGGNVEWESAAHPRPYEYVQSEAELPDAGWLWASEGTFHFGVRGEAYDEFDPDDLTITLTGQSCDPASCVPVAIEITEIEGEGPAAMYVAAFAEWELPERMLSLGGGGSVSEGADGSGNGGAGTVEGGAATGVYGQKTDSSGLLSFILLAIGAGLFTLLMPCTYPMIPITISFFTKQAEQKSGSVVPFAIVYGVGIVLMFVLLGVLAGPLIVPFATHPVTNALIGVLFVIFALALFGAITLNPPAFLMNAAGKASSTGGYVGVFLMGLTLVVTSFTCTGPFVGSLIAAGAEGGVGRIVIGMAAFGLTMATPFVLLALLPSKLSAIPSAGGWMNTLKVFMGFVELAASMKFFSNADIALQKGWIPREVFLMSWAAIGFVAAMYLFGRINLKGENPDGNVGPGRLIAGTVTTLGAFYCFMGVQGYQLDGAFMSAMAPPPEYTRGLVESHRSSGGGGESGLPEYAKIQAGSIVVMDDFDAARDLARERGLGLLVNFTGHT
ncbi:MAG: cytochrome c biogenesis protein CcdA [Planctomycetota bacterium]